MLSRSACANIEIIDKRALVLLDADNQLLIHASGYQWTEGPLWIDQGKFWLFSDIPKNRIYRTNMDGKPTVYLDPSGATNLVSGDHSAGSNGLLLNDNNELILFQQGDRRVAKMLSSVTSPKAHYQTLVGSHTQKRLNSPNDGVFHSNGDLYFTDPPYGLTKGINDPRKELNFQGIYRLSSQGELSLLDDSVNFPNGIALSTDEQTLYIAVSDENHPRWLAYDLNKQKKLDNKRIFYDARHLLNDPTQPGLPDGMAVHSSGVIFATGPGGVWLFTPEGEPLAKIKTGKLTANCALSADEETLFITAHDSVMTLKLKATQSP